MSFQNTDSRPRPGVMSAKTAEKYRYEQLFAGYPVYIPQEELQVLKTKATGTAAVNYLLDVFYKHEEQLTMNLNGANGKERVHPDILSAMRSYALDPNNNYNVKRSELNRSLSNKLEQKKTRERDEKDPQRKERRKKAKLAKVDKVGKVKL
ncbi:uncharacterized protein [Clytia hemisphaerica]|uniref:uncharacterized protein n=1 Tax=Clytia hemisphaerica TaxID=252671 RepID=UPI0034D66EB1